MSDPGRHAPIGTDPATELPSGSRDPSKAKNAAAHPDRPGEQCRADPGRWVPIVDPAKCEGKEDCVGVCPYSVFELGTLTETEYRSLGLVGRMKARAHDRKTSRTPRASACRACGLCVVACPEHAVRLQRLASE